MTAMRRALGGAAATSALIGALLLTSVTPSAAETRLVQGAQLVLTDTLSGTLTVGTDPSLSGTIRLSAQESLACLSVVSAPAASEPSVVVGTAGCGSDLSLHVDVPPTMAVTLIASGDGTAKIADLEGRLVVTTADSFDIWAGHVGSLMLASHSSGDSRIGDVDGTAALEMTGSGDVRLRQLHGTLALKHVGSGDLAIGGIEAPAVDIEGSGSGDTLIGEGNIASLHVHTVGSGDLAIAATIAAGVVDISGGGDAKLGRVNGPLQRSSSGGSTIVVGGSKVVNDIVAGVANVIAKDENIRGRSHASHTGSSVNTHLLTAAFAGIVLYMIWRIVKRRGGVAAMRARRGQGQAAAPLHPGVAAVADAMTRLEQRLGCVEGYVTSREFDLNQKFRDLGRQA